MWQSASAHGASSTRATTTKRNQIWKILDVKDKQRAIANGGEGLWGCRRTWQDGFRGGCQWHEVNARTRDSTSFFPLLILLLVMVLMMMLVDMWQVVKIFCRIQFPSLWSLGHCARCGWVTLTVPAMGCPLNCLAHHTKESLNPCQFPVPFLA